MTHSYKISGMTCGRCKATVRNLLSNVKAIKNVSIDLPKGEATIQMDKHVPFGELQLALKDFPRYQITENGQHLHHVAVASEVETRSWFDIYKPILLIFGYITGATILLEVTRNEVNWARWMEHLMAGFFLVFSFFKLLDIRGFAQSYSTYDIVAKKWIGWGYLYPFVELALGIAFMTGFSPVITNAITLLVMTISIVGVLQSVLNKRGIKCACLGAVFNLPMSTITIIEDALMVAMSGLMLLSIFNA